MIEEIGQDPGAIDRAARRRARHQLLKSGRWRIEHLIPFCRKPAAQAP